MISSNLIFPTVFADDRCLFQSPLEESIWGLIMQLVIMDSDTVVRHHNQPGCTQHSPRTCDSRNSL